jgi:hypothetical protein
MNDAGHTSIVSPEATTEALHAPMPPGPKSRDILSEIGLRRLAELSSQTLRGPILGSQTRFELAHHPL